MNKLRLTFILIGAVLALSHAPYIGLSASYLIRASANIELINQLATTRIFWCAFDLVLYFSLSLLVISIIGRFFDSIPTKELFFTFIAFQVTQAANLLAINHIASYNQFYFYFQQAMLFISLAIAIYLNNLRRPHAD